MFGRRASSSRRREALRLPLLSVLQLLVAVSADSATDDAPRIAADEECGTCAGFLAGGENADDVARSAHAAMIVAERTIVPAAGTVALDLMVRSRVQAWRKMSQEQK